MQTQSRESLREAQAKTENDPDYARHQAVLHAPAKCPACRGQNATIDAIKPLAEKHIGYYHTCRNCGEKFRSRQEVDPGVSPTGVAIARVLTEATAAMVSENPSSALLQLRPAFKERGIDIDQQVEMAIASMPDADEYFPETGKETEAPTGKTQ